MSYHGYPMGSWYGEPQPPLACSNQAIPPMRPLITARELTARKVLACDTRRAFGVAAPFDVLRTAVARAVQMLDNTINQLVNARTAVCQGGVAPPSNLDAATLDFLRQRLSVCVDDVRVWTAGTFDNIRSVAEVIRRLARVRDLIASNHILYICNPATCGPNSRGCGNPDTWAFVCESPGCQVPAVVRLCRPFWVPAVRDDGTRVSDADQAEFQAQTIIHEASHIYHCTEDLVGVTIGVAECLTQFVAITNGSPIDPTFADACAVSDRCLPAAAPAAAVGGFGLAAPAVMKELSTRFDPRRAIRIARGSTARGRR